MRDLRVWASVGAAAYLCVTMGAQPARATETNIANAGGRRATIGSTSPYAGRHHNPDYFSDRNKLDAQIKARHHEPEYIEDYGIATTQGKYRGRRTNYWRELSLSGDPSALHRLILALVGYRSPAQVVGVVGEETNRHGERVLVREKRAGRILPNDILTRRDAAEALGVLGDPRATQALEDALNDTDFLVRLNAARSLMQIRERTR